MLEEDFAKDQYDFSLIIGMDNANDFENWVNYELLERMIRFVIVPRTGIVRKPKVDWYLKAPHIYLGDCDKEIIECSSSDVRSAIDWGQDTVLKKLVDPLVLDYIEKNDLY